MRSFIIGLFSIALLYLVKLIGFIGRVLVTGDSWRLRRADGTWYWYDTIGFEQHLMMTLLNRGAMTTQDLYSALRGEMPLFSWFYLSFVIEQILYRILENEGVFISKVVPASGSYTPVWATHSLRFVYYRRALGHGLKPSYFLTESEKDKAFY